MPTLTSKDGTQIGYNTTGTGPAVILIDGAFCFRGFGPMPALAPLLAPHFTVYTYDRRGRGESGDTLPFALEREFEDIDALIQHAGGAAFLFGTSSGAGLALRAAASGLNVTKLAMYEPPYDDNNLANAAVFKRDIAQAVAAGQNGEAVTVFMRYVGTPPEAIAGMQQAPMWAGLEAVAPTLAYDAAAMGDYSVPTTLAASVSIPTLVMTGSETFPFMHASAHTLVNAMPNAEYRSLEGQRHDVDVNVLAPLLIEFFNR